MDTLSDPRIGRNDPAGRAGISTEEPLVERVSGRDQLSGEAHVGSRVQARPADEPLVLAHDPAEFTSSAVGDRTDPVVAGVQETEFVVDRVDHVDRLDEILHGMVEIQG